LFDVDKFLAGLAIKHDQIIANMKELPTDLKNGSTSIVAHEKCIG